MAIHRAIPISKYGKSNFTVVNGTTQPTNPRDNTIWLNMNSSINNVYISYDNPAPTYRVGNLIDKNSLVAGLINTSGNLGSQSSSYPEYTTDYIPVAYGKKYGVWYELLTEAGFYTSTSKAIYVYVAEYTADKTFVSRKNPVSYDGHRVFSNYTPSKDTVAYVRVSFRTWSGFSYDCSFYGYSPVTPTNITTGDVWVKLDPYVNVPIEIDGVLYPLLTVYRWGGSAWNRITNGCQVYHSGTWQKLYYSFYDNAYDYIGLTDKSSNMSATQYADYYLLGGTNGGSNGYAALYTPAIDLSKYSEIKSLWFNGMRSSYTDVSESDEFIYHNVMYLDTTGTANRLACNANNVRWVRSEAPKFLRLNNPEVLTMDVSDITDSLYLTVQHETNGWYDTHGMLRGIWVR